MPQAAEDAVRARVHLDLTEGRVGKAYFDEVLEPGRAGAGRLCDRDGCRPLRGRADELDDLRRQHGAGGLSLAPGDEIVTSDQEHPGVLVPLRRAQVVHGVNVRVVPVRRAAGRGQTRAHGWSPARMSHGSAARSWMSLRCARPGVPILLDAAQALGAIPVDVHALGVDFYAARARSGCAGRRAVEPCMSGRTAWTSSSLRFRGTRRWPTTTIRWVQRSLRRTARLDDGFPSALRSTWALASMGVLAGAGWAWVHEHAQRRR